MRDINSRRECLSPKTGATNYRAQLGIADKNRVIKELICGMLGILDLLNAQALSPLTGAIYFKLS